MWTRFARTRFVPDPACLPSGLPLGRAEEAPVRRSCASHPTLTSPRLAKPPCLVLVSVGLAGECSYQAPPFMEGSLTAHPTIPTLFSRRPQILLICICVPQTISESPIPLKGEGFEDASLRLQRPGAACVSHMGRTYHDSNRNASAATEETRRHVGAPRYNRQK